MLCASCHNKITEKINEKSYYIKFYTSKNGHFCYTYSGVTINRL